MAAQSLDTQSPGKHSLGTQIETGTGPLQLDLGRRLAAEALGTGLLIVAVVGSGIMAQRLSPGDVGLALFENAFATVGALVGLILMFGPVSGAHFNPIVSIVDRVFGSLSSRDTILYIVAQVAGGCLGSILANVMFGLPAVSIASTTRSSPGLWLSEVVSAVGLLLVIHSCVRTGRAAIVPIAVGLWIGAAYFFTSSSTFANPAVTIARAFSDTFAGIAPASVPMYVGMQLIGAALAVPLIVLFYPREPLE